MKRQKARHRSSAENRAIEAMLRDARSASRVPSVNGTTEHELASIFVSRPVINRSAIQSKLGALANYEKLILPRWSVSLIAPKDCARILSKTTLPPHSFRERVKETIQAFPAERTVAVQSMGVFGGRNSSRRLVGLALHDNDQEVLRNETREIFEAFQLEPEFEGHFHVSVLKVAGGYARAKMLRSEIAIPAAEYPVIELGPAAVSSSGKYLSIAE